MPQASTSSSSFPSPAHRGQLASLARHLTSDDDAEDYVHDAYVAALSLDTAPKAEAPWLRQVVRNSVREKGRRRQRWQELEPLVPEASPEATPERHLERTELSAAIRAVLDELDPKYRDVLRRRFFGDATSREIAESMGCPPGTVRWRLHEGLRRVKLALDERFGDRARWYSAAFALGVPTNGAPILPPTPTPSGTQPSMFTPALLKVALSLFTVGGVTTVVAHELGQDDPPPPPSEVSLSAAENAGTPNKTKQRSALRRQRVAAAEAATASRRDKASRDQAVDIPDVEECDREMAAFNANDDDPNADEHLIDAARCYEEAGLLGRVLLLHVQLRRRFPESANASASREKLLKLYTRLLDPNEATGTPMAQACTALVREGDEDVAAEAYIAAADCLRPAGLVGVELSLRRSAQASSGDIDDVDNDVEIDRLEQIEARLLKASETLKSSRGSAEKQGKARSAAVQAAVDCGRLHRPKDGAQPDPNPDATALAMAGCFKEKGLLGKALIVHELLLRGDGKARHLPGVRDAMQELVPRILDVNEPKDNPLGMLCVAPVEAAGANATADQYLTAADCLSEGSMLGAQADYLQRALKLPGGHDRDLVRADLKRARARQAEYKKKAKTYAAER